MRAIEYILEGAEDEEMISRGSTRHRPICRGTTFGRPASKSPIGRAPFWRHRFSEATGLLFKAETLCATKGLEWIESAHDRRFQV
jgi:hypothetical protein